MPLVALAVPALVSAAAGAASAGISAATQAGKSNFQARSFTEQQGMGRSSGYDSNAFKLGGSNTLAEDEAKRMTGMGQWAQSRDAVGLDTSLIGQSRDAQAGALGMYQAAANGTGPSAAQAQLRMGLDQSLAAQASMAASARGGALARSGLGLQGANNAAAMQGQAAGQAAMLRAQEQQAGMAGYANMANALRGTDQQQMMYQAQLQAQQRAQNDQYQQWSEGMAANLRGQQLAASIEHQRLLQSSYNAAQGINAGVAAQNADVNMQYLKGGLGAAQGAMTGYMTAQPGTPAGNLMGLEKAKPDPDPKPPQ